MHPLWQRRRTICGKWCSSSSSSQRQRLSRDIFQNWSRIHFRDKLLKNSQGRSRRRRTRRGRRTPWNATAVTTEEHVGQDKTRIEEKENKPHNLNSVKTCSEWANGGGCGNNSHNKAGELYCLACLSSSSICVSLYLDRNSLRVANDSLSHTLDALFPDDDWGNRGISALNVTKLKCRVQMQNNSQRI